MYLAEGIETDGVEMMLTSYPCILDDGTGRVVHYYHGLVVLVECGIGNVKWNVEQ